jgi:hypothetical protein
MDEDLKRLLEAMRQENAAAHAETRQHVDTTAQALRQENAATRDELLAAHDETRRHFDITAEGMRHEVRLVAESVGQISEKLDRTEARLDKKIEQTAADTQAMIKFSHAELDRRVRSLEDSRRNLEETVSDLQSRVERLEGSTH